MLTVQNLENLGVVFLPFSPSVPSMEEIKGRVQGKCRH
jgi:hypothetical protein